MAYPPSLMQLYEQALALQGKPIYDRSCQIYRRIALAHLQRCRQAGY
jgi:hypothetical protein